MKHKLVMILFAMLLSACSLSSQHSSTIIVSEGCMIYVEGLTLAQTQALLRDWKFDDNCKIEISTAIDNA